MITLNDAGEKNTVSSEKRQMEIGQPMSMSR